MCEFVSWIEHRDQILFLTDAEVFSPHGKEVLQGSRGIDFLGHGAIRAFYGIPGYVGVEHEDRRFWKMELYPEPIRKKLKEGFDANWGKMFAFFREEDLFWILQNHPDISWKRRAFEALKKHDINANGLLDIIHGESVPDDLKLEVFGVLKERDLGEETLFDIICGLFVPDNLRWKALKEFRGRDSSYACYFYNIICNQFFPDDLKRRAFREFKKRDIDTDDLFDIICGEYVPDDLKRAAFREFKKRDVDTVDLFNFVFGESVPDDLKRAAFEEFKKRDPEEDYIFDIINDETVPESLREEARKLLSAKSL